MTRFRGRRTLVTGAARGLGRSLALGIARRGGSLVLWDLDGERLDAVVAEARAAGVAATGDRVDVMDRRTVYARAKGLLDEGPVDVIVHNAGVVSGKPLLELADEEIERSFRVNAHALFWTTRAFLPAMVERNEGHLVTIASAAGLLGVAGLTDYAASKWAAVGFDESLRAELRRSAPAVRTTIVCPYFIDTGMFDGVRSRFPSLLPILSEASVSERVLRAVERNRARLWMPPLVYSIPLLRLLPVAWFDAVADFMGIHRAMDGFVGRDRSSREAETR